MFPRLTRRLHGSPWLQPVSLLWLLPIGLFFAALLYSFSRSAWLAAVLVIPATWGGLLAYRHRVPLRRPAALLLGTLALALSVLYLAREPIMQRITEEQGPILEALTSGNLDEVPDTTSFGIRLHLYRVFWRHFRTSPWLGEGVGASRIAILNNGNPRLTEFVHFHNSYLDILLQLGLVGFGFFAVLAVLLARALRRGLQRHRELSDILLLAAGGLLIVALVALTDLTLIGHRGIFLVGLLGGIIYAVGGPGEADSPTAPSNKQ
jgi:O-antigen ligase